MRSRGWCLTVNNYTSTHQALFMDQEYCGYRYAVIGHEIGKKNTPHLQIYLYYDNARWFDSLKKLFPMAHIEPQKGSFDAASEYCQKDDDAYEVGEKPHPGQVDRQKIEEIMKNPWANFHLYNQYKRTYDNLIKKEKKTDERRLYMIPEWDRYLYKGAFMDLDMDTYEDEEIIVHPAYTTFKVEDWLHGFLPKIKRGYEIIKVDPKKVYLYYTDLKERSYLIKKYLDNIETYAEGSEES